MRTIVVGYDGSDGAKRALDRAVELSQNETALELVAVARLSTPVKGAVSAVDPIHAEECARALQDAKALLKARGISAKLVQGRGDPARVIALEAENTGADLVVVGTHGHGVVGRALLGSVSTGVLHHATCDVLVVR
jgi:nucleotide-binding universal stress UspA family protein